METQIKKQTHFSGIDGLRALSAIGIILMHTLANGGYTLGGFVGNYFIPSLTNLVFLFLIISSFSMCCGYFQKITNNQLSIETFYKKRYAKIWPYFAFLCLIDLAFSPSINSLYETFANLTLCFGLLHNTHFSVIGVGWFLGLIFVFYMVFPFFCYLINNKIRAWFSFAVALIFNILCVYYFTDATRTNIVYSGVFLFAGGIIYLYRDKLSAISHKFPIIILALSAVSLALVYILKIPTIFTLILFSLLLIYAIGIENRKSVLSNKVMKYLSNISMEIYLCHMIIFRLLQKLHLTNLFNSQVISYIFTAIITVVGAIIFAIVSKWFVNKIVEFIKKTFSNKKLGVH